MTTIPLTGPYDDERLAAIADDPVTIAVARRAKDGCDEALSSALENMAHVLRHTHGSLGVAIFEPGEDGGEYHLVARFRSGVDLRIWEESAERMALLAAMEPYVEEVSVAATHSPEAFFEAMEGTSRRHVAHRWGSDLLWVLPASLLVSTVVGPYEAGLNIVIRVLIGSVAVSLVYALGLGPVRQALSSWHNRRSPLR